MVNYGLGQRPTVIYALVSGTGTSSANLKVEQTDGNWIPLQTTADGKLIVDTELNLSGTTFEVNNLKTGSTNQIEANKYLQTNSEGVQIEVISGTVAVSSKYSDNSIQVYGTDGIDRRAVKTDSAGGIELGTASLTAIEHITAVISGTVIVELEHESDDVLIYGNDYTTGDWTSDRKLRTDTDGAVVAVISGTTRVILDATYNEDSGHLSGDRGVAVLAVRNDSIGSLSSQTLDYEPIQLNAYGDVRTQLDMIREVSVPVGVGNSDGGTQRIIVASDDPNLVAINSKLGHMQEPVISGTTWISTPNATAITAVVSGSVLPAIRLDNTGAVELGEQTLAALETITAIMSGTVIVELGHDTDSVAIYGSDGTHRIIKTDSAGGIELGSTTMTALEGITAVISGTIQSEIINASGAAAVNIQDGGNSITVDGIVTSVISGTVIIGSAIDLSTSSLSALENVVTVMSGTMVVDSVLNDVGIKDNGNSITIDGTVDLSSSTLSALETVTAIISGTINSITVPKQVTVGTYGQVSVNTSATQIRPANDSRRSLVLENHNIEDAYIGLNNSVLPSTGFKVPKDQTLSTDIYTGAFWGITVSGTTIISYIEV